MDEFIIEDYGLARIREKIKSLFVKAGYTNDKGETIVKDIFKIEDEGKSEFRVYVYLDDTDSGTLKDIVFIDEQGKSFVRKNETITKDEQKGMLIAFKFNIREVISNGI